jgi:hypothetical protein
LLLFRPNLIQVFWQAFVPGRRISDFFFYKHVTPPGQRNITIIGRLIWIETTTFLISQFPRFILCLPVCLMGSHKGSPD